MTGRKSKINDWLTPEKLFLIENWAKSGLSDEQIAKNIGISITTYYKWKRENTQFSQAIKKGKEITDFEVVNALYQSAMSGNVTAQIFWLKNRMPDKWSDKPQAQEQLEEEEQIDELSKSLMSIAEKMEKENNLNTTELMQ